MDPDLEAPPPSSSVPTSPTNLVSTNVKASSSRRRSSKLGLLREKAVVPNSSVNPFVGSKFNHNIYNRIKTVILFPLGFIRLLLCLLLALLCALLCTLCLQGVTPGSEAEQIGPKRRACINFCVSCCCRAFLFVLGFYWISVKGRRDKTCKLVICNHTTMLDVVVLLALFTPSFLSKAGVLQVPLIGTVCRAMQVIGVDRFNPNDKLLTKQKLQRYVNTPGTTNPPLCIFPEGTTSRYDTVLRFKPGAFDLALPIQPLVLHWRFNFYDPSSCATINAKHWLLAILTQIYHCVEVEFLPVLIPQPEEQSNALFFASNAQRVIHKALSRRASSKTQICPKVGFSHDVFVVDQNVDDFLVWKYLLRADIPKLEFTMQTYSLESIRSVLSCVSPMMEGKIELKLILQVCERYTRVYHSSVLLKEHKDAKSFLSFSDLLACVLKEQAGVTARDVFLSAFCEACMFPFVGSTEQLDFRQFATALIWLSKLHFMWGTGNDLLQFKTDEGLAKWISIRSRIVFAFICSHQPLRDEIVRFDVTSVWGEEGTALWDGVFGEEADDDEEKQNVRSSATPLDQQPRLMVTEFKETMMKQILLLDVTQEEAEDNKRKTRQVNSLAFLDFFLLKIDEEFQRNYFSTGSFFLHDEEERRQPSEDDVEETEPVGVDKS